MTPPGTRPLPSLIATDLDGTLLDAHGHVGDRNRAALERAHAAGIPILLTTGRPVRWLADLDVLRPVHPHVICSNGAVRFDLATGEIEEQHVMPPEVTLAVAEEMRARVPSARLGVEIGKRWGHEADFPAREDGVVADLIAPIAQLVTEPVVKLLVVSEELDTQQLAEALLPIAAGRLEATWSTMIGGRGLVEVCAPGVSKASSLLHLCDELGLDPADAVAFGDMPNDLAMLRVVGHPHVMANAHPVMLAEAADRGWTVAPHHDEGGVGQVLDAWLDAAGA